MKKIIHISILIGTLTVYSSEHMAGVPTKRQGRDHDRISKSLQSLNINEAYIPYDPAHGVYGFFVWLEGEMYDSTLRIHGENRPAKLYHTDIHGLPGFILTVTDPQCEIRAFNFKRGRIKDEVDLRIMETNEERVVVFVNKTSENVKFHELLILVVGKDRQTTYNFYFGGYVD